MKATLIDHMGNDLRVVNAARVSFGKGSRFSSTTEPESDYPGAVYQGGGNVLSKKDKNLIRFLARGCMSGEWDSNIDILTGNTERKEVVELLLWAKNMPAHWTPFSHPQITVIEKVPIFVARQRFKHMVGFTYNETSRRYVSDEPEFHVPTEWRSRPVGGIKQGSAGVHPANDYHRGNYASFCETAQTLYHNMIEDGVAPEQARMILPQSMMTEYYVTGSLYAWANAYIQRSDGHAQIEIQKLAAQWDEIIAPLFPVSWAALTQGDF